MVKKWYVTLPWPPSINNYWRHAKNRHYISAQGVKYRNDVCCLCEQSRGFFNKNERLLVTIDAYPPDRRKRDLDNVLKSLLDALQHAEVYEDDSQIDQLYIGRNFPLTGTVVVTISPIDYQGISSLSISAA